jgi:hypothetical protein
MHARLHPGGFCRSERVKSVVQTSYNGWEASPDPDYLGIYASFSQRGVSFPGGVLAGDVSVVLGYVLGRIHDQVEPLHPGWCWGYNFRASTNSPNTLSCHSSGTAADVNAPDHGDGAHGTFTPEQQDWIRQILREVGGVVTWGGDWDDDMHFEIGGTPAEVAAVAAGLAAQGQLPPGAEQPPTTNEGETVTDQEIDAIAQRVWSYLVGGGGAGATLEEIRQTNRDINAKCSKLCDPRNHNVDGTG